MDLLVGQSWEELRIFIGVPGPDLFARNHQKVDVALTADERYTRMDRWNQGKFTVSDKCMVLRERDYD